MHFLPGKGETRRVRCLFWRMGLNTCIPSTLALPTRFFLSSTLPSFLLLLSVKSSLPGNVEHAEGCRVLCAANKQHHSWRMFNEHMKDGRFLRKEMMTRNDTCICLSLFPYQNIPFLFTLFPSPILSWVLSTAASPFLSSCSRHTGRRHINISLSRYVNVPFSYYHPFRQRMDKKTRRHFFPRCRKTWQKTRDMHASILLLPCDMMAETGQGQKEEKDII